MEDARAVIESAFQSVWRGEIDDYLAEDYLDHDMMPGLPPTRDGFRTLHGFVKDAFPDYTVTVDQILVDGDLACLRVTNRGTNTGSLFGQPPTNRTAEWTTIAIMRWRDGRFVERWGVIDRFGMLQQLGLL